jgi:hypothetical protein
LFIPPPAPPPERGRKVDCPTLPIIGKVKKNQPTVQEDLAVWVEEKPHLKINDNCL